MLSEDERKVGTLLLWRITIAAQVMSTDFAYVKIDSATVTTPL